MSSDTEASSIMRRLVAMSPAAFGTTAGPVLQEEARRWLEREAASVVIADVPEEVQLELEHPDPPRTRVVARSHVSPKTASVKSHVKPKRRGH